MAEDWDLIDALLGGTRKMREKFTLYLPMDPKELTAAYMTRLSRTFLKPSLRTAIDTGTGSVFKREVNREKVHPAVNALLDDVDLQGNDITRFLSFAFRDMLTYGHCHLLATYPAMGDSATLADAKAAGARPYGVRIDPRNTFSWRKADDPGPESLDQVRFFETIERPKSEWDADTFIKRIHVLMRGSWQTWESPAAKGGTTDGLAASNTIATGDWVQTGGGAMVLPIGDSSEIPWTTIYAERVEFMVSRPPFLDLAWLQLRHWQQYSDYANILHVAQVPTLFLAGMTSNSGPIVIGSANAISADDPNAKADWIEHSGAAIGAGRQELLDLEAAMDKLGAALFADDKRQSGDITATQVAVDTAEEEASLAGITRALEDGSNQFLWHLGRWLGLDDAGELTIRQAQPVIDEQQQPMEGNATINA